MNMTRLAHDVLCSEDSDITCAVFTHGTDSLDEIAFLMDALVNCGKPVVGTGAMRPWTDLSYDGDAKFFQAVALATNEDSKHRGAMVAFNDRILSGFWVTKLIPNVPDAFGSTAKEDLGAFLNNMPYFYNK
jgi:L-asparaginase